MKSYKSVIIFILIIFCKTGNVLCDENIFNVNNIELDKSSNVSNKELEIKAIKQGFAELKDRLLLDNDKNKLSKLSYKEIKDLVLYYRVSSKSDSEKNIEKKIYNIKFDKNKLHKLFFKMNISYSEIVNKELYLLPIFKKDTQIFVYNQNFFYTNWKANSDIELIEVILPLENIEIIQKVNTNKENLLNLNLINLFPEYKNKNLALIIIEDTNKVEEKIFLRMRILGKKIDKNIVFKRRNLKQNTFYDEIIKKVNKEIINTLKSQNLVDVRTPSFINTKLIIDKKNTLVELNRRLEKIDLIDSIFVQEFNNQYIFLKIRYLGKINKIIKQLNEQRILLDLIGDEWRLKII